MNHKKIALLLLVMIVIFISACTPTGETANEMKQNQTTAVPTVTATKTQKPTATKEPTATMTATPSPAMTIMDLIRQGSYAEAVTLTEELVESGEFASMNEAILEAWLPVIREQTCYSDRVIEKVSPRFDGIAVNEDGLAVIVDDEGNLLIEKTAPGVSNVAWAIPIMEIAHGRFPLEGQKELAEQVIEGQFEDGLKVGSSSYLYGFNAVIDDETQLAPEFELPDGKMITTVMHCYYYDAQGNLQMVNIPLFTYDPQEFSFYITAGGLWTRNSINELNESIKQSKEALEYLNDGPMVIEGITNIESGRIVSISFNMISNPSLDSFARDYFEEAVSLFHSQDSFDAFAQTGDPNHLPIIPELEEPILIPFYVNPRTVFYSEG